MSKKNARPFSKCEMKEELLNKKIKRTCGESLCYTCTLIEYMHNVIQNENGTFYNEDGIPSFEEVSTEGVDLKNPEAKDYRYFEALAQEYAKLPEEEKEKDRVQVRQAIAKIKSGK